jgi:hypothetical protein
MSQTQPVIIAKAGRALAGPSQKQKPLTEKIAKDAKKSECNTSRKDLRKYQTKVFFASFAIFAIKSSLPEADMSR